MTVELDSSDSSALEQDAVHELPPSPKPLKRSSTLSNPSRYQHGHSKGLSINFPILVPTATGVARSTHESMLITGLQGSSHSQVESPSSGSRSPAAIPRPFLISSEPHQNLDTTQSPDFLTLLASQERKVLELKEELQKAETELTVLKKQWAVHEANKKRGELKHKTVKLGPVSPKTSRLAEDEEEERERRREAREKRLKGLGILDGDTAGGVGSTRKSGQRVFEGRHTRTLSLLQCGGLQTGTPQTESALGSSIESNAKNFVRRATESAAPHTEPTGILSPLSRQSTLQNQASSTSTGTDPLSFGKTYKDLANAASRRSIPPGADVFVKQSKQMYEGVSQGFWNFVEDIRQATIGEEAINGVSNSDERDLRRTKSQSQSQSRRDGPVCEKHGKRGPRRPLDPLENNTTGKKGIDHNKKDKDVFWKEFGLETPQTVRQVQEQNHTKPIPLDVSKERTGGREHESKSSTDSKSPPDLLADLMDGNDEEWDNWPTESPMSLKRYSTGPLFRERNSVDERDDTAVIETPASTEDKASTALGASNIHWAELTR